MLFHVTLLAPTVFKLLFKKTPHVAEEIDSYNNEFNDLK
jgi:hypothetical protein